MSLRDRLIGAWELVCYKSSSDSNPPDIIYPMGKDCKGIIIYSGDGYMSAQLQVADVPQYANGWLKGTEKELATAAKRTISYTGPFALKEQLDGKQFVTHHVKIAIPPNWNGGPQVRTAEMIEEDGEEYLILGPESTSEHQGKIWTVSLRWKRLGWKDRIHLDRSRL